MVVFVFSPLHVIITTVLDYHHFEFLLLSLFYVPPHHKRVYVNESV